MIVTEINSPKAAGADELAAAARDAGCRNVSAVPKIEAAMAAAGEAAGPDDLICVTGSFYLAADARNAWLADTEHQGETVAT